jgi:hypothetical protein
VEGKVIAAVTMAARVNKDVRIEDDFESFMVEE